MKAKYSTSLLMTFFVTSLTYAGGLYHPYTGDLVVDEDSVEFSVDCGDETNVTFNDDGSIDFVYDFIAEFDVDSRKACQVKVDVEAPYGWKPVLSTESSISGFYFGKSYVVLEHTLAGTSVAGEFEYFTDSVGTYALSQESNQVMGYCGGTVTLKTVVSLRSLEAGGFIEVLSGALNGETSYNHKYHIGWVHCN